MKVPCVLYANSFVNFEVKNIMNKALLIGGLVVIIIAAIITPNAILNYKIHESKETIIVKLLELPNCNNHSYKNKFLTLEFKGIKTILRTSCKYVSNFHVGQQIEMFHKEGTNNFIFPNEDVFSELISALTIGLLGIIIVIIALKK